MRGMWLTAAGIVIAAYGVAILADAVLRKPLGPDQLRIPTALALIFFSAGALLAYIGYRRVRS